MSEAAASESINFESRHFLANPRRHALELIGPNWDFLLLVVIAAVVFQPWSSKLLPVTDFGTFLVERGPSDSMVRQFLNLVHYYAVDGRMCLVQYLEITLAARIFGTWAPGWYLMYFLLNCWMLWLGRTFLIRTGVAKSVVIVPLALFATMGPTAEAWIRPTGEPFALMFMLVALRFALNFGSAPDWRRRTYIISACAVGIVYSKEILVVLLPVVWLVTRLKVVDGKWSWDRWSERDRFVLIFVATVTGLALVPAGYVALTAPSGNYASQYGHSPHPLSTTIHRLETVVIPTNPRLHRLINILVDTGWSLLLALPSLLWLRLIGGGIAAGPKKQIVWPLIIACTWIIVGLLAYLPWPNSDNFYMLPFAFGAMFGSAHALQCLVARRQTRLRAVLFVGSFLVAVSATEARTVIYHRQMRAKLYGATIDTIVARGHVVSLVGATPQPSPDRLGWAKSISGFGFATKGMQADHFSDMSCDAAKRALVTTPGLVVISTGWGCGKLSPNSIVISAAVPRYEWPWIWEEKHVQSQMFVAESAM